MKTKIVTRNIPPDREDQNDRFRVQYGNAEDIDVLEVQITRNVDGEMQNFLFNGYMLPDMGSIYFTTTVEKGKLKVIWTNAKPIKNAIK